MRETSRLTRTFQTKNLRTLRTYDKPHKFKMDIEITKKNCTRSPQTRSNINNLVNRTVIPTTPLCVKQDMQTCG